MTTRVIPHAAVQAAAKFMQSVDVEEGFGEYPLSEYTEYAAAILEAGAQYMLAEAWDEGYGVGNAHNGRRDANPYRQAPK